MSFPQQRGRHAAARTGPHACAVLTGCLVAVACALQAASGLGVRLAVAGPGANHRWPAVRVPQVSYGLQLLPNRPALEPLTVLHGCTFIHVLGRACIHACVRCVGLQMRTR